MKRVFTLGDVRIESTDTETTLSISTGDLSLADENQASISLSELHIMDDNVGGYVSPAINGRGLRSYDSGGTKYCETYHDGTDARVHGSAGKLVLVATTMVEVTKPFLLNSTTISKLSGASPAGQLVYVSDESGGAVLAFSDGTNWRRVTDRAIVS